VPWWFLSHGTHNQKSCILVYWLLTTQSVSWGIVQSDRSPLVSGWIQYAQQNLASFDLAVLLCYQISCLYSRICFTESAEQWGLLIQSGCFVRITLLKVIVTSSSFKMPLKVGGVYITWPKSRDMYDLSYSSTVDTAKWIPQTSPPSLRSVTQRVHCFNKWICSWPQGAITLDSFKNLFPGSPLSQTSFRHNQKYDSLQFPFVLRQRILVYLN